MVHFDGISETPFSDFLIQFIEHILSQYSYISDLHVYCDFTRLDRDMIRFSKVFSRKLSNTFSRKITLEFRPSHLYRHLQFADLEVGIFRKSQEQKNAQKSSAVDVS